MKVVLINSPGAKSSLDTVRKWFGIDFIFDIVEVNIPYVPMQKHPTALGLAVLDMDFVAQHKNGLTLFIAPYQVQPSDKYGNYVASKGDPRASVNGIFLPPFVFGQRTEWWWTRLFWNSAVIQVFANVSDHAYVDGHDLGPAIDVWLKHEMCHWLKWVTGQEDTTHKWFYPPNGTPDVVRDEIMQVFKGALIPNDMAETSKPSDPLPEISPSMKVANAARSFLGQDASPDDQASDDVACAESVCKVLRTIYPDFPVVLSTATLKTVLDKDRRFRQTMEPAEGAIIVSPRTSKQNGHTGIMLSDIRIASNESKDGKWKNNYSFEAWVNYFRIKKGLRVFLYRPVA